MGAETINLTNPVASAGAKSAIARVGDSKSTSESNTNTTVKKADPDDISTSTEAAENNGPQETTTEKKNNSGQAANSATKKLANTLPGAAPGLSPAQQEAEKAQAANAALANGDQSFPGAVNRLHDIQTPGQVSVVPGAPNNSGTQTPGQVSPLTGAPNNIAAQTPGQVSVVPGAPNNSRAQSPGQVSIVPGASNGTIRTPGTVTPLPPAQQQPRYLGNGVSSLMPFSSIPPISSLQNSIMPPSLGGGGFPGMGGPNSNQGGGGRSNGNNNGRGQGGVQRDDAPELNEAESKGNQAKVPELVTEIPKGDGEAKDFGNFIDNTKIKNENKELNFNEKFEKLKKSTVEADKDLAKRIETFSNDVDKAKLQDAEKYPSSLVEEYNKINQGLQESGLKNDKEEPLKIDDLFKNSDSPATDTTPVETPPDESPATPENLTSLNENDDLDFLIESLT